MIPATILKTAFPADVVDALLAAYTEIESNYALGKWKASELDAGHFVEAGRRMIEAKLFGTHTAIGTDLPKLTDREMVRYENGTRDEAFIDLSVNNDTILQRSCPIFSGNTGECGSGEEAIKHSGQQAGTGGATTARGQTSCGSRRGGGSGAANGVHVEGAAG